MMNKMKQNDLLHLLGYVTKLALLDFNGGFFFPKTQVYNSHALQMW